MAIARADTQIDIVLMNALQAKFIGFSDHVYNIQCRHYVLSVSTRMSNIKNHKQYRAGLGTLARTEEKD